MKFTTVLTDKQVLALVLYQFVDTASGKILALLAPLVIILGALVGMWETVLLMSVFVGALLFMIFVVYPYKVRKLHGGHPSYEASITKDEITIKVGTITNLTFDLAGIKKSRMHRKAVMFVYNSTKFYLTLPEAPEEREKAIATLDKFGWLK